MKHLKLFLLACLAGGAGAAAAQEATLNAVLFVPRNTTFGEIFVRFVERTNADGKGLVQIKLIGGPDAIPTFEQGNAIRNGVVDMVSLPPTFYTNICPECDAQILAPQMTPQLKKTPFWTVLQPSGGQTQEKVEHFGETAPMGRPGQPVEIAPVYVFLGAEDSDSKPELMFSVNVNRAIVRKLSAAPPGASVMPSLVAQAAYSPWLEAHLLQEQP